MQPRHLRAEQRGVAGLPAVGNDQDDRAAGHAAHAVAVIELAQRRADPGAACPVGRGLAGAGEHRLRRRGGEERRQPGEPGREREHLGPRPRRVARRAGEARAAAARRAGRPRGHVHQLEDGPRVRLHRAGDVAQHHEPPLPGAHRPPGDPHRFAAGPRGLPHRAAHVQPRAVLLRPVPPGAARRHRDHQLAHERGELRQLGRGELREVALAQPLGPRGDAPDSGHAVVRLGVGVRFRFPLAPHPLRQRLVEAGQLGGSSSAPAASAEASSLSARSADSTIMFCCGAVTSGRRARRDPSRTSR